MRFRGTNINKAASVGNYEQIILNYLSYIIILIVIQLVNLFDYIQYFKRIILIYSPKILVNLF